MIPTPIYIHYGALPVLHQLPTESLKHGWSYRHSGSLCTSKAWDKWNMLQNNILLILLVSVFHLKRSRINEQWKRLYQKFPLSWCIMQQLKNIQKATLLSRLCRSPLSHCEQHLSDSFILIYSIVYNRGPNINQCKAKMMSERFKRMCEQNKHILLYFQLIFPHSCENTGCDGNGRELMAVLSHSGGAVK